MKPFAMLNPDLVSSIERGYSDFPADFIYDPVTQMSNTLFLGGTLVLTSCEQRDSDTKSDSED